MEKTGVSGENQRPVAKECAIYFYALLCKRYAGIYLQNMMLCSITMYYITTTDAHFFLLFFIILNLEI
jgi:hypothetical protein